MRVTHVITRLIVGGAQENTVASVLGLRSRPGWDVDLISGPTEGAEGSLLSLVSEPGLLTEIPHLIRPVHPFRDALAFRELTRLFRRCRPDLVHTHSGKAGVLGRLAARRANVPRIVHTIHGPSFGRFQGPMANAVFRTAERIAGRATDHFVTVADAMTRQYLAAGIGQPEDYTRILSGFCLEPFLQARPDPERRRSLGLEENDFVVGKIARLTELKGHEDLFAVLPELLPSCPRLRLLLVGDGPWRQRFESRLMRAGLRDRVVFTGLVPPEKIPELVGIMDTLVHLSLREGLPRALPQALAACKPVVAYDVDGAGEVCRENETGFLVRPGDRSRVKQRLLELAADPRLRERLGQAGRELVQRQFSVERMVDDLETLYRRLKPVGSMTAGVEKGRRR